MAAQSKKPAMLCSSNLSSTGLSDSAKRRSIQSYIQSQKAYMSTYAAEGKTARSSWSLPSPPTPDNARVERRHDISVFETPVLKARVPEPRYMKDPCGKPATVPRVRGKENEPVLQRETSKSSKEKEANDVASVRKTERKAKRNSSKSKSVQQTIVQAFSKPSDDTKTKKKRARSPDTSDEHSARLAERRGRRRAKRAITRPNSSQPDGDIDEDCNKVSKTNKLKGTTNMAAGLALMHGFTANNVSKNRLTVKPKATVGVFNKGKASTKTITRIPSTKYRQAVAAFSEDRFLNKKARESEANTSLVPGSDSESKTSLHEINIRVPTPASPDHRTRSINRSIANCSSRLSTDDVDQHTNVGVGTRQNDSKANCRESVIWDIELDENSLVSPSLSQSRKIPEESVVIVNTRNVSRGSKPSADTATTNELGPIKPIDTNETNKDASDNADALDQATPSSLGPSESASQLGRDRSTVANTGETATAVFSTSKYFTPRDTTYLALESLKPLDDLATRLCSPPATGAIDALVSTRYRSPVAVPSSSKTSPKTLQAAQLENVHHDDHPCPSEQPLDLLDEIQALESNDFPFPYSGISQLLPIASPVVQDYARFDLIHPELSHDELVDDSGSVFLPPYSDDDAFQPKNPYGQEYGYSDVMHDEGNYGEDADMLVEDQRSSCAVPFIPSTAFFYDVYDSQMESEAEFSTEVIDFADDTDFGPYSDELVYCTDDLENELQGPAMDLILADSEEDRLSMGSVSPHSWRSGSACIDANAPSLSDDLRGFSQGRAILLGLSNQVHTQYPSGLENDTLSTAEQDVARRLQGHWLPQRL